MQSRLFLIFLTAVIFSFFSKLHAQQFHGGAMLGLVGSQVAGDTYSGFSKAGLFAGGYVSLDLNEHSALQMELTYFQKGSRENPDSTNNFNFYLLRLNYIEIPLLYQYKLNKWIFFAGPSVGINVGHHEEFNGQIDFNDNLPSIATLQINAGLRFFISEKFGVDFRTNNSLLNIRQNNVSGDVWRFWGYGQFNDALVISVFYQFR